MEDALAMHVRMQPHHGGQIGLAGLAVMLGMSGCAAFVQRGGETGATLMQGSVQTVDHEPSVKVEAQAVTHGLTLATFIVKFKDEPDLVEVARTFRRDKSGALKKFDAWRAGRRELSGLVLTSANYSGELLLALPVDDPQGRSPEDVLAALKAMSNIAYADIDSSAHPSKKD